jgi:ribonucleoside-diphosphate reductase subunit M1
MVRWIRRCLDGRRERVAFDKITARINKLSYGLNNDFVDPAAIAQKVHALVKSGRRLM